MKPRHQRMLLIGLALGALAIAAALVLSAFQKNLVFFFTPSQVAAGDAPHSGQFRIGGMVQAGSIARLADGVTVTFSVTDHARTIPVRYRGALPDLFKESKGVVAQGALVGGMFVADQVLAKHDENYMPPEAAYALEQGKGAQAMPSMRTGAP